MTFIKTVKLTSPCSQCLPVYSQSCRTVTETVTESECSSVSETSCQTTYQQNCNTSYEEQCNTVTEQECQVTLQHIRRAGRFFLHYFLTSTK